MRTILSDKEHYFHNVSRHYKLTVCSRYAYRINLFWARNLYLQWRLLAIQERICICNETYSAEIPIDLSLQWRLILLAARFCICNWTLSAASESVCLQPLWILGSCSLRLPNTLDDEFWGFEGLFSLAILVFRAFWGDSPDLLVIAKEKQASLQAPKLIIKKKVSVCNHWTRLKGKIRG